MGIAPDSIEKRQPPEPDILCIATEEGPVAFELVEIVDQQRIARLMGDQADLMDYLRDTYRGVPQDVKRAIDQRFSDARIEVNLRPDVSLRRRRMIAADIVNRLATMEIGFKGEFTLKQDGIEVSRVKVTRREGLAGPHFQVPAGSHFQPAPVASIQAKFRKCYESDAPIELLAYYDTQHSPLEEQLRELGCFIEENKADCGFRRIWVFDCNQNKICLVVD